MGLSSDSSLAEAFKIGGKGTGVVQLMAHITVPLCLSNIYINYTYKNIYFIENLKKKFLDLFLFER